MDDESTDAARAPLPPRALVRALRRLLRPLVRLLLEHRITYPVLTGLVKSVFVEVADREFALTGKRQTTSRLSLLTGIHRKDVKRLREQRVDEDAPPPAISLGAQLVARWIGLPEYLDADGRPLPLPRAVVEDGSPSFEKLVASVSKDIRARSVLDEWLRLGVAEIDAENRVRLVVAAFVPEKGFDEKAFYLGRNLADHVAAAANNLAGTGPAMLDRSVYYGSVDAAAAEELAALSEREGSAALQTVNRRAIALRDRSASGPRYRITFGVYFYREPAEPGDEGTGDA